MNSTHHSRFTVRTQPPPEEGVRWVNDPTLSFVGVQKSLMPTAASEDHAVCVDCRNGYYSAC